METLRMRQAVIQALADELESDERVFLIGEDIGEAGGAFKATEGLYQRFGGKRVIDTPISEMAFLGAAVGSAATGLRPVVEMMFIEFIGVALDQLTTEAAKFRYLSRGQLTVPLTVRAAAGAGLGFGCQHSQMLDQWFRGTPGLKVVVPSGARSAYGLLRAAIRDDDPVVVLEHKALYGEREDVEVGDQGIMTIGKAEVRRSGTDVTVIGLGKTTGTALEAAALGQSGWSAEVIDLLTLVPWDRQTVIDSVRKTKRLVIIEEAPQSGGWGADISDEVSAELFGHLLAPVLRIATPDVPIPYNGDLESKFLPTAKVAVDQINELIKTGKRPSMWWELGAGK
ncbi:MAG: alpha-ketoacid dehydrogenase subunit beta [Actinobacteria bacterium]|uniref:Unannotated protein n=1 Tax=freshwater metagenome TaxID=449393 RepID=A0A6J6WKA2_9ZZZZ|nr:alpha-ketoacid dehydrogenase subunit beta [Actinomycetota bacterium]